MKILLLSLLVLTGCASMTPGEKKTAMIVGGVVVTAIVISAGSDSPPPDDVRCSTVIGPNGQDRSCQ